MAWDFINNEENSYNGESLPPPSYTTNKPASAPEPSWWSIIVDGCSGAKLAENQGGRLSHGVVDYLFYFNWKLIKHWLLHFSDLKFKLFLFLCPLPCPSELLPSSPGPGGVCSVLQVALPLMCYKYSWCAVTTENTICDSSRPSKKSN